MVFRAIGDTTKKIYATGQTKAELMRKLHAKYETQPAKVNKVSWVYPEPLWIEKFVEDTKKSS